MFNWFRKKEKAPVDFNALDALAEKGDTQAQQKLVELYYEDDPKNYALSFKWARRLAAKTPDCCLMLQVADMYDKGQGVALDKKQALTWFEHTLSCSIMQGRNSPLSTDVLNYVQGRIQTLRAEVGAQPKN